MTSFFWSANIDCQKPYFNFSPPYNLRITNASLHFETKKEGKNVLEIIIDGKKHPICALSLGGIEQTPLNLFFYAKSNLYFTANGNGKISICGNFLPEDDDDEEGYEEGYEDYSSDENELPETSLIQQFFGDGILDSSDDEEYEQYSSEEFNYELSNKPRIEVLNSSEEEENKIIEQPKKEKIPPKKNLPEKKQDSPNQTQKNKRKLNSEEKKEEEAPKKQKVKKAKKKINKESDLFQITPRNKGIFLNTNFRKFPHDEFYLKDLTGSHEKKIQVGSLVNLYFDIYDNNYNKLFSSEKSQPITFYFGVNKIVDFLEKTVGEMRWNCLKIIKLSTLNFPQHRRQFFSKYFNLDIPSTDKLSYIYLKICPQK